MSKKLARKQKACTEPFGYAQESPSRSGSQSRHKYRKIVAALYERVSNSRQDFLHKLSHKLVSDSQAVIVENLNVKFASGVLLLSQVFKLSIIKQPKNLTKLVKCGVTPNRVAV